MNLFTKGDFGLFEIDGLDERMEVIRERIQPKFQYLGDEFNEYIHKQVDFEGGFHIAQHRRRTTNPPSSTWCSHGGTSRGYKKFPHIQVGINEEHIFIWLALIDNPKHENEMGKDLLRNQKNWNNLPEDFIVSKDHTISEVLECTTENVRSTVERLLNVKKGEFMIGRIIPNDSDLLSNQDKQLAYFKETYDFLIPLYRQLLTVYFSNE